jgi:DNA-binding LytR/AlgR family response regulator
MPDIKCLIIDDEPLARKLIAGYVEKLPNWEIVGACKNAVEAYEVLMKSQVDVLFLDINMPVVSGLDFYRSLKKPPILIFTTAYPEFAVEGFELEAADYLVKPITFERFLKAAERIHDRIAAGQKWISDRIAGHQMQHIFIRHFNKLVKVWFDDIFYLEARKDFVMFVTEKDELLASITMKEAEDILPSDRFLRVHRSYIVAIDAVTAMFGNTLEIRSYQIPVGNNYKDIVAKKIR